MPATRAPVTRRSPPPDDLDRADRLEEYASGYRDVYGREDRYRRFVAYLGTLLGLERRPAATGTSHSSPLGQALQHFVSHSPWEATQLLTAYRLRLGDALGEPGSVWVAHDAAIPKRGRSSVGAMRQFAPGLGKKLGCQVAVVVAQVGPSGYVPLAVRLYLPKGWLRDAAAADRAGVPEVEREPVSKGELAAAAVAEVLAGTPVRPPLAADGGVRDDAWTRSNPDSVRDDVAAAAARAGFARLLADIGLGTYEGRSWRGWHNHAALVLAAHGYTLRG